MKGLIEKLPKKDTLRVEYEKIAKVLEDKSDNIYNQESGYLINSEDDLHIKRLRVNTRCADYYKGSSIVTPCKKDQEDYVLSGCEPDPKHPFNCIEKCSETDLESGKCKSSFVPFNNATNKGDCKGILVHGEKCIATCSPGYKPTETTCYKGKIIKGFCQKFKTQDKKGVNINTTGVKDVTFGKGEKKRVKIMKDRENLKLGIA